MAAARAAVFRVDTLMSVDRAGSELSAVNRRAGTDSATTLSPWTAEALDLALSVAAGSGGALDVTAGPIAAAWESYRNRGAIPPQAVRDSVARLVGWRSVRFDRATRRVWLPARGMRLDLGGIARGFALDRALDALRAAGVRRAVVDLGGNFAVLGTAPVAARWSMALQHPFAPGEVFAAVQVDSGALGTLGDSGQFFEAGGVRYSHVVDPRTHQPARGIVSVSVMATSGILSDALSRTFYVLGPEAGCRLAARYPGVQAIWVRDPSAAGRRDEAHDAHEGIDPRLVVITDGLAEHLELISEEPPTEHPTRCSALLSTPAAASSATPRPLR
jgi:thiamine biosynthesis lipoprotein